MKTWWAGIQECNSSFISLTLKINTKKVLKRHNNLVFQDIVLLYLFYYLCWGFGGGSIARNWKEADNEDDFDMSC